MSDIISQIVSIVAKSTPILATALGTASPIAGLTLSFIASLFGANPKDPADILAKMQADNDSETKLKQLELQLNADTYKTEVEDRESARNFQLEDQKITGKRDWMLPFLAITGVLSFNLSIIIIFFTKLDPSDHDVLYMMIGQLTSVYVMIYSCYYGKPAQENATDSKISDMHSILQSIKNKFK